MNYWDILPCELQNGILGYLSTTIQKIWRGKSVRQGFAVQLINELLIEITPEETNNYLSHGIIQWKFIDVFCPRNASIIEYCANHVYAIVIEEWRWTEFITTINHDLWLTQYSDGPRAVLYNRVSRATTLLRERLNLDI